MQTANWGLHERDDQWAYRAVLILQFIVPLILIVGSFVLPESPRWLMGKGRKEDCLRVLRLLRRGTPDEVIQREVYLLDKAEEEQRTFNAASSWMDCFRYSFPKRTASDCETKRWQWHQPSANRNCDRHAVYAAGSRQQLHFQLCSYLLASGRNPE